MGIERCNLIRSSLIPICPCLQAPPFSKRLIFSSISSKLRLRFVFEGSTHGFHVSKGIFHKDRIFMAMVRAEKDRIDEGKTKKEANQSLKLPKSKDVAPEGYHKASKFKKRVISGLAIGVPVGGIVVAGGWVFTIGLAAVIYLGAREYFELVRSHGIAAGMTPPPRYLSQVCSVICTLMPILTLYFGNIDVAVTSASFVVAAALLLQRGSPRFAQLSSTMFGLFYCGYLPCFWIKLRCSLAAPALNTKIGRMWPILLGGQAHWTVGLVATLTAVSSIIAADTCAFLGGKAFGRKPLITISPKKTWEGALAGMTGCVATSIIMSKVFSWPKSVISMITFGVLNFFGSLFGDLIESMIKRDAGVKDSRSLILGHGGILDRTDSYIFTGALAYSFVKFLPLFGV